MCVYVCMYVCACMYTLTYNNNAKIKIIIRFSAYECIFMWNEVMWSRRGRTLPIRRGFQVIERSRRKICCPQKGRRKKEREGTANCQESVK